MKNYYEIKIYTEKDYLEPLLESLQGWGIDGFVIEDPDDLAEFLDKKNSFDWDYVDESVMELAKAKLNVTFYLDREQEDFQELINNLSGLENAYIKAVSDDQWVDKWKEYFKATKISDKITIVPSWDEFETENKDDLIIKIDPGMAFGTGTHETTTLCIKLMEKYLKKGQNVLDVGCGSGILSIGAMLLGAGSVTGIDIDEEAVKVSKENANLNELPQINVIQGDLTKGLDVKADLVVANLMADLVIMLSGDIAEHLQGDAIYISSGILTEKREKVAEVIKCKGFEILEVMEDGDWCAICAHLKAK